MLQVFAKQILLSASLVVVLGGTVRAQAPATPAQTDDEARPDLDDPLPPPLPPVARPLADPAQPRPTPPPPYQPTGKFMLGAGYATDAGVFAHAHVSQSNLFGYGYLLSLDAKISSLRDEAVLRFVNPHLLDSDFSLDATLYDTHRVLPGFTRDAQGSAVQLGHALGPHLRGFAGYRLEHVSGEPGDPTPIAHGDDTALGPQLQSGMISSLFAGVEYNTLDRPVMPLHGTSAGMSVEYADRLLGSDFQLTRTTTWVNTHQPLGPFTLHAGGSLLTIDSRDPLGVPLTERLFLDGSSQIRGFAPGALGPIDPLTGTPLGGNLLVTGHVELEAPIVRRLGLSVDTFYDAGGVFNRAGAGQFGQSTGFGVIWRSPLGPLRLDLAFPLGGGSPRLVFGFGTLF